MSIPSDSLHKKLGRQRNPEPPEQVSAPPPSLVLYVALIAIAAALLFASHASGGIDESGLFVNLASDIIGAVLILLLVEHRLRRRELSAIRHAPRTAGLYIAIAFSSRLREIVVYARVLAERLDAVAEPHYLPRPALETALAERIETGAVLVGGASTGKSTLLQRLARKQAIEALRNPRSARVPVILAPRGWNQRTASEALFETMRSYCAVSAKTFWGLARRGRLLCVFDSVDEAFSPAARLEAIGEFRRTYPGNAVFLSTRPFPDGALEKLGLPILDVPPLDPAEEARLVELRMRSEEGSPRGGGASSCPAP